VNHVNHVNHVNLVSLVNPATAERMTVEIPARVGPTQVRFELPPRQDGPPTHYHDRYDETFEVIEGELSMVIAGRKRLLRAGDRATVWAGTLHSFRNASDAPVVFRTIVPQGEGFQRFVRGWYGLAIDGRADRKGPRHLLEMAVLIEEGDIGIPHVPRWVQRVARRMLVALAGWTGALDRVRAWW
jgi:mannose-6-phosphate isomerase-like protein (cupin superfamily)